MPNSSSHLSHQIDSQLPDDETVMDVRHLGKSFHIHHLNREIHAFHDVSFQAKAGEFIRIAGVNGSGKSSLLRCIHRTYLSSTGSVHCLIDKQWVDITKLSDYSMNNIRKSYMGFVTQFLQVRPRISALNWVIEGLENTQLSLSEKIHRAEAILSQLRLKQNLWNAYPSTFSGGEQQKVNLARGLIHSGKILLLDEPTASLDQEARKGLYQQVNVLKNSGVTILGVLHHPEDLEGLIDRTVEL